MRDQVTANFFKKQGPNVESWATHASPLPPLGTAVSNPFLIIILSSQGIGQSRSRVMLRKEMTNIM